MARGQKSFQHLNKSPVNDDEIYMMVMLYTYQHKSLEYLARKFNISSSVAKGNYYSKSLWWRPVASHLKAKLIFI